MDPADFDAPWKTRIFLKNLPFFLSARNVNLLFIHACFPSAINRRCKLTRETDTRLISVSFTSPMSSIYHQRITCLKMLERAVEHVYQILPMLAYDISHEGEYTPQSLGNHATSITKFSAPACQIVALKRSFFRVDEPTPKIEAALTATEALIARVRDVAAALNKGPRTIPMPVDSLPAGIPLDSEAQTPEQQACFVMLKVATHALGQILTEWSVVRRSIQDSLHPDLNIEVPFDAPIQIFISCSGASTRLASKIQHHFSTYNADKSKDLPTMKCTVWNQSDVFLIGHTVIERLCKATKEHRFAIFLFGADDETTTKNRTIRTTRDNVIFEYGLFMGYYQRFGGYPHAFILRDNSATLPSDLDGLSIVSYDSTTIDSDKLPTVASACTQIITSIENTHRLECGV